MLHVVWPMPKSTFCDRMSLSNSLGSHNIIAFIASKHSEERLPIRSLCKLWWDMHLV